VETIRLGLRLIRREGPGASSSARWPIHEFLQQQMSELERVYRTGLRQERGLAGETRIQVLLTAQGEVKQVLVILPVPDEAVQRDLTALLTSWTFPPPPGRGEMRVDLALTVYATFRPATSSSR